MLRIFLLEICNSGKFSGGTSIPVLVFHGFRIPSLILKCSLTIRLEPSAFNSSSRCRLRQRSVATGWKPIVPLNLHGSTLSNDDRHPVFSCSSTRSLRSRFRLSQLISLAENGGVNSAEIHGGIMVRRNQGILRQLIKRQARIS